VPKLPRISGDELIRALERMGFVAVRQKGSHVVMKRVSSAGVQGTSVPRHRELAIGTLHGILRQAGVSVEELEQHL
jgi:predicted RNA binding protein YcfA (HicA-like mRNA interferase family)